MVMRLSTYSAEEWLTDKITPAMYAPVISATPNTSSATKAYIRQTTSDKMGMRRVWGCFFSNRLKSLMSRIPTPIATAKKANIHKIEIYGSPFGLMSAGMPDISAGELDKDMFATVAELRVPYVMMHMLGRPQDMQQAPHYDNVVRVVFLYFARKVQQLRDMGAYDLVLDPGFGFGKTLEHNYELMARLEEFSVFELPLLVGISRKSMIYKLLGISPEEALNGTTVLHTIALQKGADILRVHDVRQAVEAVRIVEALKRAQNVTL